MLAVEILVSITELPADGPLHIVAHFDKAVCGGEDWLAEKVLTRTENAPIEVNLELTSRITLSKGPHISYFVVVWGLLKNDSDVHFCRRIKVSLRSRPVSYEAPNYTISVTTRQHPTVNPYSVLITRPSQFSIAKYYHGLDVKMHRDYGVVTEKGEHMLMHIDDPIFGKATVLSQLLDCIPTQKLPVNCWTALGKHYMLYCRAIGKQPDPATEWARLVSWVPVCCFDYRKDTKGMDDARTALASGNGDCEDMVIAFLQCLHMFQEERFTGTDPVAMMLERMRAASLKYAVGFGIVQLPSVKRRGKVEYKFHTTALAIPRETTINAILGSRRQRRRTVSPIPVLVLDCTTVLQITPQEVSLPIQPKWRKLRQVNRIDTPSARKYYNRWLEFYTDTHIADRHIGGFEFIHRRKRGVTLEQLLRGEFSLLSHPPYSSSHQARAQMESRFRMPALCLSSLTEEVPVYGTELPMNQTPLAAGWLSNREMDSADTFLEMLRSTYDVLTIRQSLGYRRLSSTLVVVYQKSESSQVAVGSDPSDAISYQYMTPADIKYMHSRKRPQLLVGGVGDDLQIDGVDPMELKKGVDIEMEHIRHSTKLSLAQKRSIALDIAMDHLAEIPDYYTRLARMEARALSQW